MEGSGLSIFLKLSAVLLLVLANALFVAAEFSLFTVRKTRIDQLVTEGNRAAKVVRKALDDPNSYIAAAQVGITMASLGLGWIGEPAVARLIEPLLQFLPGNLSEIGAHSIAIAIAFITITTLHIIIGEQAPKSLAIEHPEGTVFFTTKVTKIFMTIFHPFIWLTNKGGLILVKSLGLKPLQSQQLVHSEEELLMLVKESHEEGVLEAEEKEMIASVFEFGDTVVKDVMVPRVEMVCVEISATMEEILDILVQKRYSRIPVYEDNIDNIVGIIHVKNILNSWRKKVEDMRAIEFIRLPYFVPETKKVSELLKEFQRKKLQIAIVLDEYGGTAGLVTLEDLVEEIIGEIEDEYEGEKQLIVRSENGAFVVDARLEIEKLNEELELEIPNDEFKTVGGLIYNTLGRIPTVGEELGYDNLKITITKADRRKVYTAKLEFVKPDQEEEEVS